MTEKLSVNERFECIEHNLDVIRYKIADAAVKSGRKPKDITLMAVTKTVEPIFINHAIECGIELIGENKVQEFLSKEEYLKLDKCKAHLIGHLQTNKVRQIVGKVQMIESVDSLKLAKEIDKQSLSHGVITDCLIEINIGEESSKTGLDSSAVYELLNEISVMSNIRVKGLMAIPPICDSQDILNSYFSKMHEMFIDIKAKNIDNISMEILSMGMSGDYVNAVLNGSNLVRIGSSIFGPRIY